MAELITRRDLWPAVQFFAKACKASMRHSQFSDMYLQRFGDQGAQISGIVRDHFPDYAKNILRRQARLVTEYSDAAWSARPKRVRMATMRRLASEVAADVGHGFYGPQP